MDGAKLVMDLFSLGAVLGATHWREADCEWPYIPHYAPFYIRFSLVGRESEGESPRAMSSDSIVDALEPLCLGAGVE